MMMYCEAGREKRARLSSPAGCPAGERSFPMSIFSGWRVTVKRYREFLHLFDFLRFRWRRMAVYLLARIFTLLISMLIPLLVRSLIDQAVLQGNAVIFRARVTALFLVICASFAIALVMGYCLTSLEQLVSLDMRRVFQARWARLPLAKLKQAGPGTHIFSATTDTDNLSLVLLKVFPSIMILGLQFLAFLLIAAHIQLRLTVLFVLCLPCVILIEAAHARSIRPFQGKLQRQSAEVNDAIAQYAAGISTIKSLHAERYLNRRYVSLLISRMHTTFSKWRRDTAYQSAAWAASTGWSWVVVVYGMAMVMQKQLTLGTLVALKMYLDQLAAPLEQLGDLIRFSVVASVSAERLSNLIRRPKDKPLLSQGVPAQSSPSAICHGNSRHGAELQLENLRFGYDKSRPLYTNLNATFRPATLNGITGPSGSGKSTLVSLIAGLYQPDNGHIRLDGTDVFGLAPQRLSRLVTVMPQETFLFRGTVGENIACGLRNVSEGQIRQAAKMADAHTFIADLERGFDSVLGDGTIALSPGQMQRLSLARVMLRSTKLLVLDEAMNSLDTESKLRVLESIRELARHATILVVTHDIDVLRQCDSCSVLTKGQMESCGSFDLFCRQHDFGRFLLNQWAGAN
jgi:ABC-type multidrug transport system fused ATPase/permease subunit